MSQLKRNMVANLIGRAWDRIVVLVCIPFYLKFLGIEAYGLVGFYAALLGIFVMIDLGFGKTLNRELARLSALDDHGPGAARPVAHPGDPLLAVIPGRRASGHLPGAPHRQPLGKPPSILPPRPSPLPSE